MTIISDKAYKVLNCTILRFLPELDLVTGFKDLGRKIIETKVEERCEKK